MTYKNIGLCYEMGYKFQQENPEYILVHGYITNIFPPFQTIDHCWCTKDNVVYDAVMEKEFEWGIYKALYKAEIEYTYSFNDVLKIISKEDGFIWHEPRKLDTDKYYKKDGSLKKKYRNYKEEYDNYIKVCKETGNNILSYEDYKYYFDKQIKEWTKNRNNA